MIAARLRGQLDRIARLNPVYRAMAALDEAGALAAAEAADGALAEGAPTGVLHGMTVAVKDNIDTAGMRTACGSRLFVDHVPKADATAVARLRRAGAIIVGKASMMELAFGVRGTDAVAGQCLNPWSPDRVPGGSSGGSAAAVALDFCTAALGTDTGGSVRVPAAFCGVTGLRPTHGRISNKGCLPVSVTFDTIGPMARHVEEVARLFCVLAAYDDGDPLSQDHPVDAGPLLPDGNVAGLRIGVPENFYFEDIDPEVEAAVRQAIRRFADAGAIVVPVRVPGAEIAHAYATDIILSDVCALHARALDEKRALFSDQVYERMIKGRLRSGTDYAVAMRFREDWRRSLRRLFGEVDLLLTPASPHPAPPVVDPDHLEDATRHATRFTYGGGLAGIPGLSLPSGMTAAGLPIGMLLEAAWCNEALLLRAGAAWQSWTDWHRLRAPCLDPATAKGPPLPA